MILLNRKCSAKQNHKLLKLNFILTGLNNSVAYKASKWRLIDYACRAARKFFVEKCKIYSNLTWIIFKNYTNTFANILPS